MSIISAKSDEELNIPLILINRYVKNVEGYRFLEGKHFPITYGTTIQLNFLREAILCWCKLFGTNSEEYHWKNLFHKNFHDNFRDELFEKLSMSHDDFMNYWKEMLDLRNEVVAHTEKAISRVPDFRPCDISINHLWESLYCGSIDLIQEQSRREAELQLGLLLIPATSKGKTND